MTAFIRDTLVNIGIAVLIFLGVQATIQSVVVQQHSMTPTLEEGQFLFVNKAVYFFSDPGRGDIIVFHPPDSAPAVLFIKRIIGLPGGRPLSTADKHGITGFNQQKAA